jgi:hypothetical protein
MWINIFPEEGQKRSLKSFRNNKPLSNSVSVITVLPWGIDWVKSFFAS